MFYVLFFFCFLFSFSFSFLFLFSFSFVLLFVYFVYNRCINRIQWSRMEIIDCRNVTTAEVRNENRDEKNDDEARKREEQKEMQ